MSGGGSLSPIASVVGQVGQSGSGSGPAVPGANYTPVSPGAMYQSNYQPGEKSTYQSNYNPEAILAKSMLQMPKYESGLQAAMQQMAQQYNRPAMKAPMQQGLAPYNDPALSYKPNMSGITTNLNRVAPSVAEQQRLQAIEDARIAAEQPSGNGNSAPGTDNGG